MSIHYISCIMGQPFSWLLRRYSAPPSFGPLVGAPVDVLLLISDQLAANPEAIVALSLTCKSLYVMFRKERINLRGVQRKALLLLLEKDFGDKIYYCPFCSRLHPFSPSWSPTTREYRLRSARKGRRCRYARCPIRGQAFYLHNHCRYSLGYHHARLVMNRHLFGAPNGLPLDNLQDFFMETRGFNIPPWTQDWTARIIDNELFLSAVHNYVCYEGSPTALRALIDREVHFICPHVVTADPFGSRVDEIRELKDPKLDPCHPPPLDSDGQKPRLDSSFIRCRDVLRFCSWCLTDFTITIEWVEVCDRTSEIVPATARKRGLTLYEDKIRHWYEAEPHEKPDAAGWQITITAYHQFGRCRSPRDWKWKALASWERSTPRRNTALYPVGSVMQKWQRSVTT
ncbi:hypothetical protein F4823DRAFT_617218 [Ustulina deusta]|nr:hypothetical protein F4823DRAFT_617218 [Ustulina deusta]